MNIKYTDVHKDFIRGISLNLHSNALIALVCQA